MTILNWAVGYWTIQHMFQMGLISSAGSMSQLHFLNGVIVKSSVLGMMVIYGISLFYSHAIAGPIFKFEKMLEEVAKGHIETNFQLRRFDEFRELANKFNAAMATVQLTQESEIKQREILAKKIREKAEEWRKRGLLKEAGEIEKMAEELKFLPPLN